MSLASTTALTAYFMHGASNVSHPVGTAAVVVAGGPVGSPTSPTAPTATGGATAGTTEPPAAVTPSTRQSQTAVAPAPTTAPPTTKPPTTAPRANAVVNGSTFQNQYGLVQVQVTFNPSGRLVAADAIQSPGGRSRSIEINQQAVPMLDSNALAIQSARVDTVSGATYTSDDYRQSLQSAIDAARAAHVTTIA
jgi:uncharacterized protein with FMN-binding domain